MPHVVESSSSSRRIHTAVAVPSCGLFSSLKHEIAYRRLPVPLVCEVQAPFRAANPSLKLELHPSLVRNLIRRTSQRSTPLTKSEVGWSCTHNVGDRTFVAKSWWKPIQC